MSLDLELEQAKEAVYKSRFDSWDAMSQDDKVDLLAHLYKEDSGYMFQSLLGIIKGYLGSAA